MRAKKKAPKNTSLRRKRQVAGRRHDQHIKVYFSPSEKADVEALAASQGTSASGWLSDLANTEVRRIQASRERESRQVAQ